MKLVLVVLVVLFCGFVVGASEADKEILDKFDSGEEEVGVLVGFRNNEIEAGSFSVARSNFKGEIVEMNVDRNELESLLNNPEIIVEPVRYFEAYLGDSVGLVNATPTWELEASGINLTGSSQAVCVIDSGVNYTHPDLLGKNLTACNIDCISGACVENCSEEDLNGHGTHVAGIVGAAGGIKGIARGVGIIGVKVFPGALRTGATTTGISNAISWCVDNSEVYNISVISLSLGTETLYSSNCDSSFSLSFTPAVAAAVAKNISVVAASGNNASLVGVGSPSCLSNVIGVGGADKIGGMYSSGNRNSLIKLLGIATSVNSTINIGGYSSYSGTSMATPMVSGAIAIINQLLYLTSRTMTPLEIEDVLNDTGYRIYDSESELNYSRINIYDALLSLDVNAPGVTLVSPVNNHVNVTENHTLVCNVTDWQLANVTLKVWNSAGIYYNESVNVSGVGNETSFDLENMPEGDYDWNCLSFDVEGNSGYAVSNFSLAIGGVDVDLDSPANGSYTNVNETNFSCTSRTDLNYELSNVSFYLWNSSGVLIESETKVISGFENVSVFNWTFEYDDDYLWGCVAVNNNSNEGNGVNYSLVYDSSDPSVVLTSLPSSVTSNSVSRDFGFNVSDVNIANCSLIVNGEISLTNSSVNVSLGQLFSQTFTPGSYSWEINCSDLAGNVNSSDENSFVVTAVAVSTGSGGSSSSGSSGVSVVPVVFEAGVSELSYGYTKVLKKNEKINFSASGFEGEWHLLTVNNVSADYVNLTIESDPINLLLRVGESVRLNLSSDLYYDLLVELNSIGDAGGELMIRSINESIEKIVLAVKSDYVEVVVEDEDYFWVVVIVVLVVIMVGFFVVRMNRKKLKVWDLAKKGKDAWRVPGFVKKGNGARGVPGFMKNYNGKKSKKNKKVKT